MCSYTDVSMNSVDREKDDMRMRAEWMVPSDDTILELIEHEGNLTPGAIEALGGPVSSHAGHRCRQLARYKLLEQVHRGLYRLTDTGEKYLEGDLDASTLDPVDAEE